VLLWDLWQTTKASPRWSPGELLEDDLRAEFGGDWLLWASDIDQAVHEFGTFVEGKIDERIGEYLQEIQDGNARRARMAAKSSTSASFERPSKDHLRRLYDEAVMYWVHAVVREYTAVPGAKGLFDIGWAYQQKRATFDPAIDFDWDVGEVEVVYLDEAPPGMTDGDDD